MVNGLKIVKARIQMVGPINLIIIFLIEFQLANKIFNFLLLNNYF